MLRRASWTERRDDDQASAAAGTREGEGARPVERIGAIGVGRGCASGEQRADAGDVGGAIAVSQESPGSGPGQAAWRMRWKPRGRTCIRKRRMTASFQIRFRGTMNAYC